MAWRYSGTVTVLRDAPKQRIPHRKQHVRRKPVRGDTIFTNSDQVIWLRAGRS